MVDLTQSVRSQTSADLGQTDLPECNYRCSIGRQGLFYCRHSQVHTPDQLVDTCLCRSCDQRDRECLLPRLVPSLPYQKPAVCEPGPWQYISLERLVADVRDLIGQLPQDLTAVAGIPRSGMLPAAQIATILHLPLYSLGRQSGLVAVGHGLRLESETVGGKLLVVDDSVYGGIALSNARAILKQQALATEVLFAALYPRPQAIHSLDYYAHIVPEPHLFEWNLFNCGQTPEFGFDLDGIFCQDWSGPDEDDDSYQEFLRTAKPRWLPRRRAVGLVVTARLEKYRRLTEDWLRRHQVRFGQLVMGPWESAAERRRRYDPGRHKGQAYLDSSCKLFVESDSRQAEAIFHHAQRPVLCPTIGRIFQ